MADLAESAIDFLDFPVYEGNFYAVLSEEQIQFGGQVEIASIPVLELVSVVGGLRTVIVTLSDDVTLTWVSSNPANWTVTGPTTATVLAVAAVGPIITLTTTELRQGGAYTLTIPGAFYGPASAPYIGALSGAFTGVGTPPIALAAQVVDGTHVRVIFSEEVNASDALTSINYVIDNGLGVLSVAQESAASFILETTSQSPGIVYLVTCSNIRDALGNLI